MDLTSILLLKLSDTMCAIAKVKVKKQDTKKALSFTVHGVSMDSVKMYFLLLSTRCSASNDK